MSKIVPFDHSLVTNSVNFHGHNLLKQLVSDNAAQIHSIKLQDIDYKVYQRRAKEIRNLGSSRVQEIIEFIASKSDILLVSQPKIIQSTEIKDEEYKDRYTHQLPLEYFMHVEKFIRINELYKTVQRGDILLTEVYGNVDAGSILKVLSFDGGKHRLISDLRVTDVKILLKYEDTVVSKPDEDKLRKWMVGTRLRVEVLEVVIDRPMPHIIVGTMGVTLSEKMKDEFKLGKIQIQDLPPVFSVTPDPDLKYLSQCIEKMDIYKNPQSIRQMSLNFGIDLHSYPSLMSSFRGTVEESEKPNALRKAQVCKWAHKSVADGVTHFKKGQHEEAFQCLNKALQIDHENVEAFVAKGALLANLGRYEKAVEDFEKALKFNPNHVNARKYMCETLVELGKQSDEKNNLKEAEKCYSRCLELNPEHVVAKEGLSFVSSKLGTTKPEETKLVKEETVQKENTFLEDFLEMENELKKKRAEGMQPVIQVKEESAVPLTLAEATKSPVKEEKEASLSPLSQKLAVQQNLWSLDQNVNGTTALPITSAAGSFPSQTIQDSSINIFSNPPPNWTIPDITKPPPIVPECTEDAGYKARVEQFLKELEIRPHESDKKRQRSREKTSHRQKKKMKTKERRKRKKRRDSSTSSSTSSSGSNSDSSSEKSSTSSSSVSSADKMKKHQKKHTKKKKKTKKQLKKNRRSQVEGRLPDIAIPDFQDLEKKLLDYYQKMEAMKTPQLPSGRNETLSKQSESQGLKQNVHPAFLENSDDEDDDGNAKGATKITSPSRDKNVSMREKQRISKSKNDTKRKKRTKRTTSSSSYSSSSSRSSSYSTSSRSRSPRRSSRSRSRRHRKFRSRSRSRSKLRHRPRSRSWSRSRRLKQGSSSKSSYRSVLRDKRRYRSRSRSVSPPRKPHSKAFPLRPPAKNSKSPPFGYYKNKPFYSASSNSAAKEGPSSTSDTADNSKLHQPPTQTTQPTLAPISQSFQPHPPPIKFEIKKAASLQAKAVIHRHLAGNKDIMQHVKLQDAVPSPDPATRFGKWAKESSVNVPTGNEATTKAPCIVPAPSGSLDQFENYLKDAKQRSLEMMKQRNKAFLKPQPD